MTPSVRRLEEAGYRTWSEDERTTIGGWTVRSTNGFTRRVNSATAIGDADASDATREAIAGWLDGHNAPLAVRVTPLIGTETLARVRGTWGLQEVDETVVLVAQSQRLEAGEVQIVALDQEGFDRELVVFNDRSDDSLDAWQRLLGRLEMGVGLWVPGVAAGIAAIHDGIAMVYSVAVHPAHRRQGWGRSVMDAATGWAFEHAAPHIALQVLGTNSAAIALYGGLGYTEAYRYSYLQPPSQDA